MGNKTRLRIGEGVELTQELKDYLARLFGIPFETIEIERYDSTVDLNRSFERRKQSIYDAFKFILKTIPPKNLKTTLPKDSNLYNDLKGYLDFFKEQCLFPTTGSIDDYQVVLAKFTAYLVDGLVDYWNTPGVDTTKKEHAIELLNKAEQYVIMKNGRTDLATLSVLPDGASNTLVLQWEKQLPPCTDDTIFELEKIKESKVQVTPEWLRELPPFQQIFLHRSRSSANTVSRLAGDFAKLINAWNEIIAKIPLSKLEEDRAIIEMDDRNFDENNDALPGLPGLPDWYIKLSPSSRAVLRELFCEKSASFIGDKVELKANSLSQIGALLTSFSTSLSNLTDEQVAELDRVRTLPYWFLRMEENEQRMLKKVLDKFNWAEDAVSFVPSRLRSAFPSTANFQESHLGFLDLKSLSLEDTVQLRYSHPGARDAQNQPTQILELHTDRNVSHIAQKAKEKGKNGLLVGTKISPVRIVKVFNQDFPDYTLENERKRSIAKLQRLNPNFPIDSTNHPYNGAKRAFPTKATDPECNALLSRAQQQLAPDLILKQCQNLSDLTDIEKDIFAKITRDNAAFIASTPTQSYQTFDWMNQLIKTLPKTELSLDQSLKLIRFAKTEAMSLKRYPSRMKERISPVSEEDKTKHALIELMLEHGDNLEQLPGSQQVLANLWYMANNPKFCAPKQMAFRNQITDLAHMAQAYSSLLKRYSESGYHFAEVTWDTLTDHHGRELWLSCYEGFLSTKMGGMSSGCCVSGKDREELKLIHMGAMLIYKKTYGFWPRYEDDGHDRANFVEIFANHYLTGHGRELAGQNAPGADGIKTLTRYLPADIIRAIRRKTSQNEPYVHDRLASNNDLDAIGYREVDENKNVTRVPLINLVQEKFASCVMLVTKLKEESRLELLELVKVIAGELTHWNNQTTVYSFIRKVVPGSFFAKSTTAPTAVGRIQQHLFDAQSPKSSLKTAESNVVTLSQILCDISKRPSPDESPLTSFVRSEDTQSLYDCMNTLRTAENPEATVPEVLAKLETLKTKIFPKSPSEPCIARSISPG
jgi:hypothetical protein